MILTICGGVWIFSRNKVWYTAVMEAQITHEREGIAMKEYQVKLDSMKKLMQLGRIVRRYRLKGRLTQEYFSAGLHPVLLAPVLPLNHARVTVDSFRCANPAELDAAMQTLAG